MRNSGIPGRFACVLAALAIGSPLLLAISPTTASADPSPIRVVAGSTSVVDSQGTTWSPDAAYAVGGSLATSGQTVNGTASPQLYRPQRTGAISYAFPAPDAGTYSVVLYVAELGGKNPGQRVYDVTAEGATVATKVDVAAATGRNAAWHVLFTAPVTDGTLNVSVVPVTGQPAVSAVAVDYLHPELTQTMTFDDEFNSVAGTPPSSASWTQNFFAGYNHELEMYTDHNSLTDGAGDLVITARKETATGPGGATRNYTSGRLTTEGHYTWMYGRAEARVLTPPGQGLWPAFWTVGSNGSWPADGEIDAMEEKGQLASTDYGTVHGITTGGVEWSYGTTTSSAGRLVGSWHTYAGVWQPGAVSALVDGKTFMTVTPADLPSGDVWPFNQPFWLLLDLAVGGDFVGSPSKSTVFPANMKVDWVRVTQ